MENNLTLDSNQTPIVPKKKSSSKLILSVVSILLIFAIGFVSGRGGVDFVKGKISLNRAYDSQSADYSLFWSAYDTLNSKFVDRPLDQQKLLHGAISGMVNAAGDPYTVFFDPEQAKQFADELQGTFDGIGAEIGTKDDQLVVIAPLDDSPAQKAGLRPNDAIISINGESTVGMTPELAASKIRGPANTEVVLSVVHDGSTDVVEFKIVRAHIEVKSLKFEVKELDGQKIGVIKLSRFGEDTQGLLNHAVDVVLQGGIKSLVLDLRSNPGGYLDTAVTTAANWVETDQVVVRQRSYTGEVLEYKSESWPRLKGIKTIVLVNGGSASASEIVAGALQDYGLATLVGEKTYGKGSVQELTDMSDNSTLKITTAKWFTPNDRSIDKNGLEPDVKVELTREDAQNERDPQMDKALELLK